MPPMLGQSNYGTVKVASHLWLLGLGCQAIVGYWGRGCTIVRRSWDWDTSPFTPPCTITGRPSLESSSQQYQALPPKLPFCK